MGGVLRLEKFSASGWLIVVRTIGPASEFFLTLVFDCNYLVGRHDPTHDVDGTETEWLVTVVVPFRKGLQTLGVMVGVAGYIGGPAYLEAV